MSRAFAALHDRNKPLLLPNAWDAASARLFEDAGFAAVGTSSAGMAYSLGYADGEATPPAEMFAAIARVARVVDVPVSADIEAGYARDVAGLRGVIDAICGTGAVGINLEDWDPRARRLFSLADAQARVAAAKERGRDALFVNARTDVYLHAVGDASTRLSVALERLRAFVEAGADGVFVPGVGDVATLAALANAVPVPLNVLAGPTTPPVAELQRLGVARVSVGVWPMRSSMTHTRELARNLFACRSFEALRDERTMSYADANELFSQTAAGRRRPYDVPSGDG